MIDKDTVYRQAAIGAVSRGCKEFRGIFADCEKNLNELPPAQSEYEPVEAEDFAKIMSENTLYSFMTWYGIALKLMEEQGFVICKKTL